MPNKLPTMVSTPVNRPNELFDAQAAAMPLHSGGLLVVSSEPNADVLSISSTSGKLRLRINVQGDAVTIESFDGRNVLSINGPLVLQADSVELSAKQHLALSSGGGVSIMASGPVNIGAASIELTASRGDVAINANDDVRMEAERIRMNA